ncbi:MAG: hypothetical protein E4H20_07990, partial [Spirochaetales bacterium]
MKIRLSALFVAFFGAMLFVSCPGPILSDLVASVRDATPPVIQVTSPSEYAPYSRVIAIMGSVTDLSAPSKTGKVVSLTYEILSHATAKPATISADGSFSIAESNDLRENIVVLLKATDWNGNETEYRLPLVFPGNEIPTFYATEGNRETTLSWSPVPGVTTYTLFLEPSSKTPDPASSPSIAGITSPYTATQLKNASVYSFLLEGRTSDGKNNYSEVVRSVPLSTLHLFPQANSFFNGIELRWRTFQSIAYYLVLRATSPSGPWEDISGPVPGPVFFDVGASRGTTYYYAIKPSASSSVISEWVEATVDSVSSRSDAATASYDAVSFSR